jgi:hypothetical protein
MPSWAFRGCKFCQGAGCLACDGESERAMEHSFNNPALIIRGMEDKEGWDIAKKYLSKDALEKAYHEGGDAGIDRNLFLTRVEFMLKERRLAEETSKQPSAETGTTPEE